MKGKVSIAIVLVAVLASFSVMAAGAAGQPDLAAIRDATAGFHRADAAWEAGYIVLPGVEHCFDNPGVGAMGYHRINPGLVDLALDPLQPEVMVYAPGPNGQLMLGAVEYIVPAEPWDLMYDDPPSVLGMDLHLNGPQDLYILHAWIWKHNPAGMFEDWNPNVSCN